MPAGQHGSDCAVSAVYYPPNQQLETYVIDVSGAFIVAWKDHNGPWEGPIGTTDRRFVPGAPNAAAVYPKYDQLKAFSVDSSGLLNDEWKVHNQAWLPWPVPLAGTPPPTPPIPAVVQTPTVITTQRLAQLTGAPDPQGLPILNAPDSTIENSPE